MNTRILQLTDLHVFSQPGVRLKGIPTRESLQDVVEHIRKHEADFDHVIITGDHTHDEQPQSYAAVRDILSPWIDRLWQVPGNHDDRNILRTVFEDRIGGAANDLIRFQFSTGQWKMVGLDTHLPGSVAGQMDASQIDWLRQCLSSCDASRVGLFFHHPPLDVGCEWMDAIGLNGRERIQQLVASDERIRLICCGHVHHEFQFQIGQADVLTTPSTGVQFEPSGAVPSFVTGPPGYRVIEIQADEMSTHVVRLPEVKYTAVNE